MSVIIPVFVPHAGCVHDCVFCNQRRISGNADKATGETVKITVGNALSKLPRGVPAELAFYGGSFTAISEAEQAELLDAARPFLDLGELCSIRVSTRPDAVDSENLKRLFDAGVRTVELGAQSMDDGVLKASGRGHTAEDVAVASNLIKSFGFKLILQMMTGLPLDTREKAIFTAKRIRDIKPDGVRIYPAVIVRDTALYSMWKSGEYKEHTVSDAVEWCADILEIFEKQGIAVIRLGLNPTDELSSGAAVAGAYHPALGEMARSRVYFRKAERLLEGVSGAEVAIGVSPGRISTMTGHKRENIVRIKEKFGFTKVLIKSAPVKDGELTLLYVAN